MGFLVNDYGKDGPTNDAKSTCSTSTSRHWAAEQGIEKYTVGKKDVKCELFLNLIVVDEHTCTASARLCAGAPTRCRPANEKPADGAMLPSRQAEAEGRRRKPAKADSKPADAKPEERPLTAKPAESEVGRAPKAAAAETSAARRRSRPARFRSQQAAAARPQDMRE